MGFNQNQFLTSGNALKCLELSYMYAVGCLVLQGASLVRMLRHFLGKDAFEQGLQVS